MLDYHIIYEQFTMYVTRVVHRGGPQKRKMIAYQWKKQFYIKSTMLSFLKVCLYGYYTNCQFYRISLFRQLKIVFRKISENHFFKHCILNFT